MTSVDRARSTVAQEVGYVMREGVSPEAEAARTLQRFMCCKAGVDLVEHGLLRPFGYTLDAGRVYGAFRVLADEVEHFEAWVAGIAQELHDDGNADRGADQLARVCESIRKRLAATREMIP